MAKPMSVKAHPKRRKHNETHRHRRKTEEKKKVIAQPKKRMSHSCRKWWHRRRLIIAQEQKLRRLLLRDFYARNTKPRRVGILDLRLGSRRPVLSSKLLTNARQKLSLDRVQKVGDRVQRELENNMSRREGKFLRQIKMRIGGLAAINAMSAQRKIDAFTRRRPCRLLDLPAELRERIYEYAVTEANAVDTFSGRVKDKKKKQGKRPPLFRHRNWTPSLAAACRQLRDEVLPVYFSCNTFAFRYDQHYFAGKRRDCQIRSFEKQVGADIRWIRKVKCALVHIISPKPAQNHLFCESILTAQREKFGCPIKVTVEHFHSYRNDNTNPSTQFKKAVGGCACSLQAHINAAAAELDEEEDAILEIGRLCGALPFANAHVDHCPTCGMARVVPQ